MSVLAVSLAAVVILFAGVAVGQSPTGQGMNMANMANMNVNNFNLTTMPGILAFLAAEGIDPNQLIIPNCVRNGDQCQTNGGQPCCLSPVFTCQPNRSGGTGNACYVIPAHAPHTPQIKQIINTLGMVTDKPIQ